MGWKMLRDRNNDWIVQISFFHKADWYFVKYRLQNQEAHTEQQDVEAKQYPIANIHVPKTIDNDLPLPAGSPTFGYQSAKEGGTVIGRAVYNDARTSANWFVVAAMGRSAGLQSVSICTGFPTLGSNVWQAFKN